MFSRQVIYQSAGFTCILKLILIFKNLEFTLDFEMSNLIQIKLICIPGSSIVAAMNIFSRHRLRSRLSIMVIVAMLWSHVAVASHSLCINENMPAVPADTTTSAEHDCDAPPSSADDPPSSADVMAVCTAHCNQGDQSNDVARVPPVPALPPLLASEFGVVVTLASAQAACLSIDQPPPVFRHRPTAHPASLLLI